MRGGLRRSQVDQCTFKGQHGTSLQTTLGHHLSNLEMITWRGVTNLWQSATGMLSTKHERRWIFVPLDMPWIALAVWITRRSCIRLKRVGAD